MKKILPIFLKIAGVSFILLGLLGAYYGPLEIYVFYLFSEAGPFYYDGFGVGSLWFAYLVAQNLGYYLVAALMIPLGIGHLKLRYWALTLGRLYTWFWLGAGVLVFGHFLWVFPLLLRPEHAQGLQPVPIGIFFLLILVLLPILALIFYYNQGVCEAFEANDSNRYWIQRFPLSILALVLIFSIMINVLHLDIFLQNLFPNFGHISLGRPNVYVIALCVLILGILIYGTVRLEKWAWWGSLVFMSLLTLSSIMSFLKDSFYEIILIMDLPANEMALIDEMTVIHDLSLVILVTAPLLAALGLLIYSHRYFGNNVHVTEL